MAKRALFILNPAARRAPPIERLRAAIDGLAGWETSLELTQATGHATELAREAAERGLDAAVACGGDGTVNEVANGLASAGGGSAFGGGSTTALAVVRGGTANVWAKEARIPRKLSDAVSVLADGEVRTIDLGRASAAGGHPASGGASRYFLALAGAGFDAAIVREVHGGLKRRLGATVYVLHGLRRTLSYRETEADIRANGDALSGSLYWLVLGNTRSYGGLINITDRAKVDDGRLDLVLLRRGGLHRLVWLGLWLLLRRHHQRAHVVSQQVESLEIATPGLPVQLDGEYLGETPLRFEVAPGALRVIVPRGLRSPLFSDGG